MSMSNTITVGPENAVSVLSVSDAAAVESASAAAIRKFWIHDPPKPEQKQKGHPRTLIAFRVNDNVITFAHTTWNPDYPEPFDRAQAVKRAEGRLRCPKRQHTIKVGAAGDVGTHMTILTVMAAIDQENDRINTARYSACRFAMTFRTFKATD